MAKEVLLAWYDQAFNPRCPQCGAFLKWKMKVMGVNYYRCSRCQARVQDRVASGYYGPLTIVMRKSYPDEGYGKEIIKDTFCVKPIRY